jgi:rhizoxin synthesis polyketide synthase RhiF
MLRPLSAALADKENILAVIKSTALGHAGSRYPSLNTLRKVIEKNFSKSRIDPASVGYIEASANGSAALDALEMKALVQVFQNAGMPPMSCPIGSVKSNIGHAAAASGMSQLMKVILQMQYKTFVPSLVFGPLNAEIDFSRTPFYLNRHIEGWSEAKHPHSLYPRRAIINSFGAGGTYGNVIVEEAPAMTTIEAKNK